MDALRIPAGRRPAGASDRCGSAHCARSHIQRSPHRAQCALLLGAALVIIAGCASAPPAVDPQAPAAPEIPPQVLTRFEQAIAVMAAGDLTEAELRFEEFVLAHPGYPGAHVNLAILHAMQDDDAAAEACLARALELDPAHAAALNQLGLLRRRQGRFEDAEAAYLKAVTADPEYSLAHYNLGVLYELYLQQLETALQHFERYQALSGDDEQVAKWIVDLRRRVGSAQRTANASDQ